VLVRLQSITLILAVWR